MSTGILHKAMRTLTTVAMMATVATVLSCNKSTTDPDPQQGPAIVFSPADNWTKAVIPSGDEGIAALQQDERGFKVWSWFQGTTSGHMFGEEGTDVKYNGSAWDYEDKKYWMNGTYDFAAVFPSTVTGTYAPETSGSTPVLKVTNFDVTDQDDLLVAFKNDIDGNNHPESVELSFQHTLSCIQLRLNLKAEDFYELDENGNPILDEEHQLGYATVTKVALRNVSTSGSLTASKEIEVSYEWTPSTTVGNTEFALTGTNQVSITYQPTDCFDTGMLAIPQEIQDGEGELYMEVNISFPGITSEPIRKIYNIPLNAGSAVVPQWEANKRYIYSGEIDQNFSIEFAVTTVNRWEDKTLGGFIVVG